MGCREIDQQVQWTRVGVSGMRNTRFERCNVEQARLTLL